MYNGIFYGYTILFTHVLILIYVYTCYSFMYLSLRFIPFFCHSYFSKIFILIFQQIPAWMFLPFNFILLNKRISVNTHTNHSISYLLLISLSFMHAPTFHICLYHLLMFMSSVPFIHAHIISFHFHTCINISFIFKQGTCMYFTL